MTQNIHTPAKAQAACANVAPICVCLFERRHGDKAMKTPATITRRSPKMRANVRVTADNVFTFKKTLRPYVAAMQDRANGFESATVMITHGMEYSVRLG